MKKLLCLLLASLLILPALSACGDPDDGSETGDGSGVSVVTEPETQDPRLTCDLPDDLNYNDEAVHIIYADNDGRRDELHSDGLEAGLISATVYERNDIVQHQLHVTFDLIPQDDAYLSDQVNRDITAGSGEFDVVVNGTYRSVTPAMEGKYIDLNRVGTIDTSKLYWTQGYNDIATFTDQEYQFLASGPLAISMFRFVFLNLYNRQLMDDRHIPDLYETAKAGDWTLDYQMSIIEGQYQDKDGDGKKSRGDFFGFVSGSASSIDPYFVTSDIHLITKDTDTRALIYNADALGPISDLADKVQLLYYNADSWIYQGAAEDWVTKTDNIIRHFTDGRAMMVTCLFYDMESKIEDLTPMSYGLVPLPKFDKAQPAYHSYVQDQVSCFGISSGVKDEARREMCGAVLEALAYHSNLMIKPAYYDSVLSLRFMQDPESKEMLDLIFDTIDFDFCSTCRFIFSVELTLREIVTEKGSRAASMTKRWQSSVEKSLAKYNEQLDKLFS
ncbi:MAG: hypothetical protein MJ192_09050 [Clostridia bacterium]|nr:hypothetical protein [Clostridia bacterium]